MAVAPLDVIQTIVEMTLFGSKVLNVFHLMCIGGGSDPDVMEDIAVDLDDKYALLQPYLINDLSFDGFVFKNITQNYNMGEAPFITLTVGAQSAEPLPPGTAALITLRTPVPKTRGRKFIPGIGIGSMSGGLLTGSLLTEAENFAASMIGGFIGDVNGLVFDYGVTNAVLDFVEFTEAVVSNVPAYQRRRKQGVGE